MTLAFLSAITLLQCRDHGTQLAVADREKRDSSDKGGPVEARCGAKESSVCFHSKKTCADPHHTRKVARGIRALQTAGERPTLVQHQARMGAAVGRC